MPLILGIETSCDETAAAVVVDGRRVASDIVASQDEIHAPFGGVVPEVAARSHAERLDAIVTDALACADVAARDLDAVAATVGPGLAGALLVGVAAAKGISIAADVPFVGVNHLDAHISANVVDFPDFAPPAIALIVSGGHTMLVEVDAGWRFDLLGATVDDAAGEAFDKIARYLGLGYPGGPIIDELASRGDPGAVELPRPMITDGLDFSFSGLKTAVVQAVRKARAAGHEYDDADVAASFQAAVADVLVTKTLRAARDGGMDTVALAGGVAANSQLRADLEFACAAAGIRCFIPSVALCVDNAAMVGAAAERRVVTGEFDPLDIAVDPSMRLG